MSKALVLVIENSQENLGSGGYQNGEYQATHEPLEEEAIRCIRSWKRFAPTDIPVFVICPSQRKPSASTVKEIESLGCAYIHAPLREAEDFTCGYFNVPLALNWFTENYNYDTIVHIDLDMYMFREVPDGLFTIPDGYVARIGRLTDEEKKDNHIIDSNIHYETCFMVARDWVYREWWKKTKELMTEYDTGYELYAELEEFAIDIMAAQGMKIVPECYHQIGKRYPVSDIPDLLLDKVYFVHNHLYEKDVLGDYLLRKMRNDKTQKNTAIYQM